MAAIHSDAMDTGPSSVFVGAFCSSWKVWGPSFLAS